MDRIFIESLQVEALIGVYDWERTQKTPLLVDVEMELDLSAASASDRVADTVDYAAAADLLERIAANSEFELLEALAGQMTSALLQQYPLSLVRLRISKPGILKNARNVAVELTRSASS